LFSLCILSIDTCTNNKEKNSWLFPLKIPQRMNLEMFHNCTTRRELSSFNEKLYLFNKRLGNLIRCSPKQIRRDELGPWDYTNGVILMIAIINGLICVTGTFISSIRGSKEWQWFFIKGILLSAAAVFFVYINGFIRERTARPKLVQRANEL